METLQKMCVKSDQHPKKFTYLKHELKPAFLSREGEFLWDGSDIDS